jgi:hypothetical protein
VTTEPRRFLAVDLRAVSPGLSPIERLIDASGLRCTVCGRPRGDGCSCWIECRCGWSYERGGACRNPVHDRERRVEEIARSTAEAIVLEMRGLYPEPMKAASGGFRRTLCELARRKITAAILAATEPEGHAGA